ncbi:MAG: HAD family hydrolase [Spirochaetota bacterium]|nr:HAD family hydrolase [Spirochaetota bacterium]
MKRQYTIKAVFFDLDGTLLYTLPDIARAVNYSLEKNSLPVLPVEYYRDIVGWGLTVTIRKAVPAEIEDTGFLEKIRSEMKAAYARNPVVETAPYPGVIEMLGGFRGEGVPMGILSNKDDSLTREIVATLLKDFSFAGVYGSSADVPPKPDTTGFNLLMEKTALLPEEIMFVGDTAMDMELACSTGAYPLGVSWGYRSIWELQEAGAAAIAETPGDILKAFHELSLDRDRDALV